MMMLEVILAGFDVHALGHVLVYQEMYFVIQIYSRVLDSLSVSTSVYISDGWISNIHIYQNTVSNQIYLLCIDLQL